LTGLIAGKPTDAVSVRMIQKIKPRMVEHPCKKSNKAFTEFGATAKELYHGARRL
jgi:hypothetical protein